MNAMTWTVSPYVKAGVALDQIEVEGIRATGYHGVLEHERVDGQEFVADVVAHCSTRLAAATDDLAKTINYADIADRVQAVLQGEPVQLVETLAERIAHSVLEMGRVECVDVRVHKPHAPVTVPFGDISISIRRDIRTGGLWADKRIGSSAGLPDDPTIMDVHPPVRDVLDHRPTREVPVVLALGSNLGDSQSTLVEAIADLGRVIGVSIQAVSPLVKSAPVGGPEQPDFLNAVVTAKVSIAPRELLAACHGIEIVHGREREVVNGPRTLDIDIIDFDGTQAETADLTLPHPRAADRGFVLVPWSLLDPSAQLVGLGSVAGAAQGLGEGVEVVATVWAGAVDVSEPGALPAAES